jgi:hypothetical protein
MSIPNGDDDNLSPDEDERDIDGEGNDDERSSTFLTGNPDQYLSRQRHISYDNDVEPIEARPPNEIDTDEQERHQSGTPAFRTLDDV